jgi:protein gp37
MKNSAIQWTDNTFNPWFGCRKVAPECEKCYIVNTAPLRSRGMKHGSERVRTSESYWKQPLRWNEFPGAMVCDVCSAEYAPMRWGSLEAWDKKGSPPMRCMEPHCSGTVVPRRARVFCLSLGDWLDEEVPVQWRADLLTLIKRCNNLDWQLLTKRPQNWRMLMEEVGHYWAEFGAPDDDTETWLEDWLGCHGGADDCCVPDNIWIGVSAGADQKAALEIPAKVHFLSCEPMLHALNLNHPVPFTDVARFDWVIFGGESGKNARPLEVDWIRQGLAFCRPRNIAAFVKQMGRNVVDRNDAGFDGDDGDWPMDTKFRELDTGYQGAPVRILLKDSHGGDMSEWPEDLRVREFPKVEVPA